MVPWRAKQSCRCSVQGRWQIRQGTNKNPKNFLRLTDFKPLQNFSAAFRNQLIYDLYAAEAANKGAVTGKTHDDQDRALARWERYCESVGLEDDVYLGGFSKPHRIRLTYGSLCHTFAQREIFKTISWFPG